MNYDELLDELFWELQPVKEMGVNFKDPAVQRLLMKAYDIGEASAEDADDAWVEGRSAGYSDAINDAIMALENL